MKHQGQCGGRLITYEDCVFTYYHCQKCNKDWQKGKRRPAGTTVEDCLWPAKAHCGYPLHKGQRVMAAQAYARMVRAGL